jgi:CheY-like chemotaxis protein
MEVICDQCQGKFKIPDEKIPAEQVVFTPCPRCKKKLTLDTRTKKLPALNDPVKAGHSRQAVDKSLIETISSSVYDASEKPFDFLPQGVKTALVCESDPGILSKLRFALKQMGYHTVEPESATDALKKMRFHSFDLIVMNELFNCLSPDDNPILTFLNDLVMSMRRNMFVALITTRFRTMDNMAAFNKSVNVVIHLRNLDEVAKVLRRAIDEHQAFYGVFQESLVITGKG